MTPNPPYPFCRDEHLLINDKHFEWEWGGFSATIGSDFTKSYKAK